MSTPFKMKGMSFGNSPLHQEKEKKRTITSDLKTKKEEPEWMKNSPEIQAKKYADERHNAALNKWRDGDMSGPAPKRSDFKPVW